MAGERNLHAQEPEYPESALGREFELFQEIRERLCSVVTEAGNKILNFRECIEDTGIYLGHELSTIDAFAQKTIDVLLDDAFPQIGGVRKYEHREFELTIPDQELRLDFVIDEIDGTTNTKRELANLKEGDIPKPQAAISIAICKDHHSLSTIQVGAVYTFDTNDTFSAIRVGNKFIAFKNERIVHKKDYKVAQGDSATRIIIVGYSNKNRREKGKWEDILHNKAKMRVYEGCRASTVDVINIIRGRYDSYVDPRALWGENSGAMLQVYDIGAVIPIALGYGFMVTDVYGNSWENYGSKDAIPLVVSRNEQIHQKILEKVKPLLKST